MDATDNRLSAGDADDTHWDCRLASQKPSKKKKRSKYVLRQIGKAQAAAAQPRSKPQAYFTQREEV